jgi:hypothetical protein
MLGVLTRSGVGEDVARLAKEKVLCAASSQRHPSREDPPGTPTKMHDSESQVEGELVAFASDST